MKLLNDLTAIHQCVESTLDIRLADEHYADGRDEVLHVFLHEACHAAIARCVPWIHTLADDEHTALDEILARLLEGEIGSRLGLRGHTAEEHVEELAMYPVKVSKEQFTCLQTEWQQRFWPARDVAGMATWSLGYLRGQSGPGHPETPC